MVSILNVSLIKMEATRSYLVCIIKDGNKHWIRQVAHTTYEAIDRVYNKFCGVQPDRTQYSTKKKISK